MDLFLFDQSLFDISYRQYGLALLEELGLKFTFPSRTVYLHHADGGEPERNARCAVS